MSDESDKDIKVVGLTQPTDSTNTCLATWLCLQDRVKNSKIGY